MVQGKPSQTGQSGPDRRLAARKARLAAALRANLQRRKEKARANTADDSGRAGDDAAEDGKTS